MKTHFLQQRTALCALFLLIAGCSTERIITDVNYARPLESVLIPDAEGTIYDNRHGLRFTILPIQYAETQDSSSVTVSNIRMIRLSSGSYLLTAAGFQHVYVLQPAAHRLIMGQQLHVAQSGLSDPAFNMRNDHVELIDQKNGLRYKLVEGKKEVELRS